MKVSFTGNGTPSIRSINVRANILSEWRSNQKRYRTDLVRCIAGIALSCALPLAFVPMMESVRASAMAGEQGAQAKLDSLQKEITAADAAKKMAEPKAAAAELHGQTSQFFSRMLGEFYQVLDSAKSGMAFSTAKVEIREAEAVIDCHGDAEGYDVAAAFADQAGSTPSKVSTLASTRPNRLLGPEGITFEYIKRVPLQ